MADAAGRVIHLYVAMGKRQPMRELERAEALANKGFDGCIHGRPGSKRQVLLIDSETLADFTLSPGDVRENVTTEGICIAELQAGQRLRLGGALLEVTGPCEPCYRMDEIRMGLQEALRDRRGILCRVVESGEVLRGDSISLVDPQAVEQVQGGWE